MVAPPVESMARLSMPSEARPLGTPPRCCPATLSSADWRIGQGRKKTPCAAFLGMATTCFFSAIGVHDFLFLRNGGATTFFVARWCAHRQEGQQAANRTMVQPTDFAPSHSTLSDSALLPEPSNRFQYHGHSWQTDSHRLRG